MSSNYPSWMTQNSRTQNSSINHMTIDGDNIYIMGDSNKVTTKYDVNQIHSNSEIHFKNDVKIDGSPNNNLDVSGNVTVGGNLTVKKSGTFKNLTVSESIDNDLTIDKNLTVKNKLDVSGITIGGNLNITHSSDNKTTEINQTGLGPETINIKSMTTEVGGNPMTGAATINIESDGWNWYGGTINLKSKARGGEEKGGGNINLLTPYKFPTQDGTTHESKIDLKSFHIGINAPTVNIAHPDTNKTTAVTINGDLTVNGSIKVNHIESLPTAVGSQLSSGQKFAEKIHNTWYVYATNLSDDRLKTDEELIKNSTSTLLKLRPQIYKKANKLVDPTEFNLESGLIAQEIYYEVPELKHIVQVPEDAKLTNNYSNVDFNDIKNDPNYDDWGSTPAGVNYYQLVPHLIKGFQEQQTEIIRLNAQLQKVTALLEKNNIV